MNQGDQGIQLGHCHAGKVDGLSLGGTILVLVLGGVTSSNVYLRSTTGGCLFIGLRRMNVLCVLRLDMDATPSFDHGRRHRQQRVATDKSSA